MIPWARMQSFRFISNCRSHFALTRIFFLIIATTPKYLVLALPSFINIPASTAPSKSHLQTAKMKFNFATVALSFALSATLSAAQGSPSDYAGQVPPCAVCFSFAVLLTPRSVVNVLARSSYPGVPSSPYLGGIRNELTTLQLACVTQATAASPCATNLTFDCICANQASLGAATLACLQAQGNPCDEQALNRK